MRARRGQDPDINSKFENIPSIHSDQIPLVCYRPVQFRPVFLRSPYLLSLFSVHSFHPILSYIPFSLHFTVNNHHSIPKVQHLLFLFLFFFPFLCTGLQHTTSSQLRIATFPSVVFPLNRTPIGSAPTSSKSQPLSALQISQTLRKTSSQPAIQIQIVILEYEQSISIDPRAGGAQRKNRASSKPIRYQLRTA